MGLWARFACAAALMLVAGCADQTVVAGDCGTCHVDATCGTDGTGQPACFCKAGYSGDGKSACEPDPVDLGACGGSCSADAQCVTRNGAARCLCHHGFWGDGRTCTETNACADHNGSCHAFAKCEAGRAITCTCAHGFAGDGWDCAAPERAYVRLLGHIELCVSPPGVPCHEGSERYTWEMSVPLLKAGDLYQGSAAANVFEVTGKVVIEDPVTGNFRADIHATTFNVARTKIFDFSTNPGDLTSPGPIPPESLPLTVFGAPQDWYFAGPPGSDYSVSGSMTAVLQQ